jgi:hypothetical protein
MKFRGKAITGAGLLTILGVACFATVLVSAAVFMALSNSTSSGTTNVGTMLTAQEQATTDSSTGFNAWSNGNAIVGNTYTDGLLISGGPTTYTGPYSIQITITCDSVISNSDISMMYQKDGGSSYTAIDSFSGSGSTTMFMVIPGDVATSSSAQAYNFEIVLAGGAPAGAYTITYQAVQAEV